MPEKFEIFYLLRALSFLRMSFAQDSRRLYALSIASFFLLYGAKETGIFFLPGLAIYEFWRKKYGNVAIMVAVSVTLLLMETAVVDFWLREQGIIFGRAQEILTGHYMNDMQTNFAHYTPLDMLRRWWFNADTNLDRLEYYSKSLYLLTFAVCGWLLLRRQSGDAVLSAKGEANDTGSDVFLGALVAVSLSFSFCATFFILSLHPFILVMPLNDRYLWVFLVPSLLVIAALLRWLEINYANLSTASLSALTAKIRSWPHSFKVAIILILAVSTLERSAIEFGVVNIRRGGFAVPYRFLGADEYYSTYIKGRLLDGCTLVFATDRAAWSAIIHAFPYGYFPDVQSLQLMKLDGLRTRDGGLVRGWKPQVAEWPGLGQKPYVWPYERGGRLVWEIYAIRLEAGTEQHCRTGYYLGHVDIHPRDQVLGQGTGLRSRRDWAVRIF
jgi:hypothetical protein